MLLSFLFVALTLQGEQPPLPAVPLDTLPPAVRERVAEAYQRAASDTGSAAASGALGMLLHAYDQFELAEACYRRSRALDPAAFDWAYLLAVAQAERGRLEEAAHSLGQALALRPADVPARLKLAEVLLARGDLEAVASAYEAILSQHPDLPQAHYGLGRMESARRRSEAAVLRYRRAVELFAAYGAAHYALGLALRDLGRLDEARAALALYDRHKLDAPPLQNPLLERVQKLRTGATALLAEGVRLEKTGDLGAAVRAHEEALAEDPQLVQAHANLISFYARLGRHDKAEEHYRAAVALSPGLSEAHYNYGVLLAQQGRSTEAAHAFQRALAVNPHYARAHNNLGNIVEAEGKLDEAEAHYRAALFSDPAYRLARFNLGRVLLAKRSFVEAVGELEKILEPEDQDTPRYLLALAVAWVGMGEREKGLRYGRDALRRAEALGQSALAASIARDLQKLESSRPR